MPRLEYFIVSESFAIDQDTNRISAFNIFEAMPVRPSALPTTVPQVAILSCWSAEPDERGEECQISIRIQPPGDVNPKTIRSNFTVESDRQRLTLVVQIIPIEHLGEIEFELLLNGEHRGKHVVKIVAADEELEASADSDAEE